MLRASVPSDSTIVGAGAPRITHGPRERQRGTPWPDGIDIGIDLATRATTVDRALTIITGGSVDVGLAFANGEDTDRAIGDAALRWTLESNAKSWLLLADVGLHERLGIAPGHSMIQVVERPGRAEHQQVGVIALLPASVRQQHTYLRSRRTTNRMCDLLDLGGIAAATVFCCDAQRLGVASRLQRRGVVAGFCPVESTTPNTVLQQIHQRGSQIAARIDASARHYGARMRRRGATDTAAAPLIDLR